MPFFVFVCGRCNADKKVLTTLKEAKSASYSCPVCSNASMELRIGSPSVLAKETTDEYRGKSNIQGLSDKLKDRSHDHFVKHDLPRIIATQGKEYAIRQGFINEEGVAQPRRKK